jgi:hypothetical protein
VTAHGRLRALRLVGAAVVGASLIWAPASSADDGSGGARTLATRYIGDTCNANGIRDCLYLHYNSYNENYQQPEGACHQTNRDIANHWGRLQDADAIRYVFRAFDVNAWCYLGLGDGQGLINNAASFYNNDCVTFQVYAGKRGQGTSQILRYNTKGPLNSGIKNNNESHYARSGC